MSEPLHVGVIGLGNLWQRRYRPALLALRNLFRVRAVCDQVEQHAAREARHLDCAVAAGPTELLENRDVQALLLLDPQWYRLWPLEAACRLGKPALCASGLDADDAHADALVEKLRAARLPVLLEAAPRLAPALRRLRELLAGPLGRPRLLLGEVGEEQPGSGPGEAPLLDLCAGLLEGDPVSVQSAGGEQAGNTTLQFDGNRLVNLTRYTARRPGARLRLHVITEHGRAAVEFLNRLHWTDADGHHSHVQPMERPLGQLVLEQFYRVVREGAAPEPSLDQAHRVLTWLRAAARSRQEGRRIDLGRAGE